MKKWILALMLILAPSVVFAQGQISFMYGVFVSPHIPCFLRR